MCRGISFDKLGQFEEVRSPARSLFLQQSLYHCTQTTAVTRLADLHHKCTLYDLQAVADFTTVLKLDPTNVNAYFNRGSAYDSLGEYEKAVADYTHALDLDSSSADPEQSTGKRHINTICAVVPFAAHN